jgi:hypothetical protein
MKQWTTNEEIKVRMKYKVSLYGLYVKVIDSRWDR